MKKKDVERAFREMPHFEDYVDVIGGCLKYAKQFLKKEGLPPDMSEDEALIELAIDVIQFCESEEEEERDLTVAAVWYMIAISAGYEAAWGSLGVCFLNDNRGDEAVFALRQACMRGGVVEWLTFADLLAEGDMEAGIAPDEEEAYMWYKRAAENGSEDARAEIKTRYK